MSNPKPKSQKRALTSEEIDRAVKTGVIPGYADQFSRDAIRNQNAAIAAQRNGFAAVATAPTFNPALERERRESVTPAGASADSLRASLGLPAKQKNKSRSCYRIQNKNFGTNRLFKRSTA